MAFLTGIVEGFYGRQWSWEDRCYWARWLGAQGMSSYLYCPKGDPFLRRRWQEDWPAAERAAIGELAKECALADVQFGAGLSPFALYLDYGPQQRRQLRRRVELLADLCFARNDVQLQ